MNADMIEDIVKAIKKEYALEEIEVDYDHHPASSDSVLDMIDMIIGDHEVGDWITSGETFILTSGVEDEIRVAVLLLKRGVEINFNIPRPLASSPMEEEE